MSSRRRAFVTGGTGFIGSAIVRALVEEGTEVRALARRGSDRTNLEGLPVTVVEGDLSSPQPLAEAMEGCDEAYHCAALYAFWARDSRDFYASNVEGSRNVVRAAAWAKVGRIVYTSSVATVKPLPGGAADESRLVNPDDTPGHYKRSKVLAEAEVLRLAREEQAPVVVVNPSAPVGPRDVKPTPTGRMLLDFLHGRMPAYVDTGLNVVDVDDVGRGHLLAARAGAPGERYILGGENLPLLRILELLGEISGRRAPRVRLPHVAAYGAAVVLEAAALVTRREPRVTLESTRLARHHMYFDPSRAQRELGFRAIPAREALERAVRWFRDTGRWSP